MSPRYQRLHSFSGCGGQFSVDKTGEKLMKITIGKKERGSAKKLMVSGSIRLNRPHQAVHEVRRGMRVISIDGQELGKVAALVFQDDGVCALAILLGRLPEILEYRLVPVNLIATVEDECVHLHIPARAIEKLLRWDSKKENGW
jgi:hypothetical protein